MAAIVFDVRSAERKLKAAGASEELAEATADLMSQAVLLNLDALVTRDYLDARLDARFAEQENRIEKRLSEQEVRVEARFAQQDLYIEQRFSRLDAKLNVMAAILALIAASVLPMALQSFFAS